MAGKYRGVLKIAGSALRGWLADTTHPARRIRFDLLIDDEFRGAFVANRRRASFIRRQNETAEDTHGFLIPIRRAWITGAPQTVRVEDPSDRGLYLSLTAKLGPAVNENFEEHFVGGEVVLGARERFQPPPSDGQPEDARRRIPSFGDPTKPLLKKISTLSDVDLASLVLAIERDILLDRIGRYDRADDWQSASAFRRLFLGGAFESLLVTLGHTALKGHSNAVAVRVLTAAAALFPKSFEANYQAGMASSLLGEFEEALRLLKTAEGLEEGGARAKQELVNLIGKMLRTPMPSERRAELRAQHLDLLGVLSTSEYPGLRARNRAPFAAALYAAGRYDKSIAATEAVLATAPNDIKSLIVRAKSLIARNEVEEARTIYERVLELERDNAAARFGLRTLSGLVGDPGIANVKPVRQPITDGWLCIGNADAMTGENFDILRNNQARNLGYVRIASAKGKKLDFWRTEVLTGLRESGLIRDETDLQALARWKRVYGLRRSASSVNTAAIIFRAGNSDHEDEKFLRSVAAHHAREGFEPILVGTRPGTGIQEAKSNGICNMYIGDTVADIRRFLLEAEASLVHAVSGVSLDVAKAVRFTNTTLVCGLHVGAPSQPNSGTDSSDGMPPLQLELLSVLERADAIYANSRFAQKVIEQVLGVRCSIVPDNLQGS